MHCTDCQKAESADWRVYRHQCPDCQIRMLANTPKEQREAMLEKIKEQCGDAALKCVKDRLKLEFARIRARLGNDEHGQ